MGCRYVCVINGVSRVEGALLFYTISSLQKFKSIPEEGFRFWLYVRVIYKVERL